MTLALRDSAVCPVCGMTPTVLRHVQLPLLRHGGYGAAEAHEVATCACRVRLQARRTVHPSRF